MSRSAIVFTIAVLMIFGSVLILFGCSRGNSKSSPMPATVNVTVSDPATCSGPQGPYSHIYVTITDVQINASSSAGDNDPGWVDLTPSLAANPQQVDLLGQASNQCFLATLGATTALQPGSYQQIRIMLAGGSVTLTNNPCGSAGNCLMLSSDSSNTPETLQLSSEAQTGLKIPSGQIAGGQFVVAAGQTKDLNIDFNACESIVAQGNGQFRLKPVLHAGEVNLTSSSINGKVVDSVSGAAIVGGNTVVALEQKDSTGVDRVIMETVTDASGAFSFCPVAAGTYDVVIAAINGAQVSYGITVITGVQVGNALGTVPLIAQTGAVTAASIIGMITTSSGTAGTAADITLSALQPITVNGSTVLVTVPLAGQSAAAASLTTAAGASCPAKTDCASYTFSVPAANPAVGAFSTSGTQTPSAPIAGIVAYTVDAIAYVQGGSTLDCSPSEMQTSSTSSNAPLNVTAGAGVTAATLAFAGCQ